LKRPQEPKVSLERKKIGHGKERLEKSEVAPKVKKSKPIYQKDETTKRT